MNSYEPVEVAGRKTYTAVSPRRSSCLMEPYEPLEAVADESVALLLHALEAVADESEHSCELAGDDRNHACC